MDELFMIENLINKAIKEAKLTFKGDESELEAKMVSKIPDVVTIVVDEVFRYYTSNATDIKRWERKIKRKISKQYGLGLELFAAFIELNSKISSSTYRKFHQHFDEVDDQLKLDVLIANHVRACQIANEIRVLVTNGYADGAHARWRTLHEICVTFLFLYDHDYETVQMYNDYEIIEKWKKAKEYRETYEQLNFDPLEESEWQTLEQARQNLLVKYGKDFGDSYGWFINHMPKGRRNFKELEKLAGQNHFRAVYGWANENVHAGISGLRQRLGLREQDQQYFLIGPSDYGFLDPVQYTAASLVEMSYTLLNMENSIMSTVYSELLTFFQQELINAFSRFEDE
jgi:hypothetical protein